MSDEYPSKSLRSTSPMSVGSVISPPNFCLIPPLRSWEPPSRSQQLRLAVPRPPALEPQHGSSPRSFLLFEVHTLESLERLL